MAIKELIISVACIMVLIIITFSCLKNMREKAKKIKQENDIRNESVESYINMDLTRGIGRYYNNGAADWYNKNRGYNTE